MTFNKSFSLAFLMFLISEHALAQYDGYQRNSDGSYTVGACYNGYQRNADGSYAVGKARCTNIN